MYKKVALTKSQVEMNMEMPFIPAGLKPSYRETYMSLD